MVLLKEERMWTCPRSMFFFSRRRRITFLPLAFAVAIFYSPSLLLLVRDGLLGALAGARVGLAALTANGQTAAMTGAAIAADLAEALDVGRGLTAKFAFHDVVVVDGFTKLGFLRIGQILHAGVGVNACACQDILSTFSANTIDVSQTDFDSLILGQVNTGNT